MRINSTYSLSSMYKKRTIRKVIQSDLEGLKNVLDSCGLFPSELLEPMITNYFNDLKSNEIWYTCLDNNTPVAIGYCVPEKFTQGTYNLLALGVSQNAQRNGVASEMLNFLEDELKENDGRILIIETSSSDVQVGARELYKKSGYQQEAVVRDFWTEGEDKIIFRKKL